MPTNLIRNNWVFVVVAVLFLYLRFSAEFEIFAYFQRII